MCVCVSACLYARVCVKLDRRCIPNHTHTTCMYMYILSCVLESHTEREGGEREIEGERDFFLKKERDSITEGP